MNEKEAKVEEERGGKCGLYEERLRVLRRWGDSGPTQLSIKCTWIQRKSRKWKESHRQGKLSHSLEWTIGSNSASHCLGESKAVQLGSLLCAGPQPSAAGWDFWSPAGLSAELSDTFPWKHDCPLISTSPPHFPEIMPSLSEKLM